MTTSPIFKHDCTALDIINRPLTQALNPIERTLLTQLIRRELKTTNSNTITCTTKGQPIILQRIVKQRKETSSIRAPTIRRRSRLLSTVRKHISGTSTHSLEIQQAMSLDIFQVNLKIKLQIWQALAIKVKYLQN